MPPAADSEDGGQHPTMTGRRWESHQSHLALPHRPPGSRYQPTTTLRPQPRPQCEDRVLWSKAVAHSSPPHGSMPHPRTSRHCHSTSVAMQIPRRPNISPPFSHQTPVTLGIQAQACALSMSMTAGGGSHLPAASLLLRPASAAPGRISCGYPFCLFRERSQPEAASVASRIPRAINQPSGRDTTSPFLVSIFPRW